MAGIAWYVATALLTLGAFVLGWGTAGRGKKWALGAAGEGDTRAAGRTF